MRFLIVELLLDMVQYLVTDQIVVPDAQQFLALGDDGRSAQVRRG